MQARDHAYVLESELVSIIGVIYAGQDYEGARTSDLD
jgi:hypothetical protein